MQAWVVHQCGPIDVSRSPYRAEAPGTGPGQIRIVSLVAGYAAPTCIWPKVICHPAGLSHPRSRGCRSRGCARSRLAPFSVRDRVGIPWLARTDQTCRYCRRGDENLCSHPAFTGWDLDGGYADSCVADEQFVYRLTRRSLDEQAAPLLCAGIIGYRALRTAAVPPGGNLGIYGFGGSAHLTAQVALHLGFRVHVLTRGEHNRRWPATSAWTRSARRPKPAGTTRWRHPVCPCR